MKILHGTHGESDKDTPLGRLRSQGGINIRGHVPTATLSIKSEPAEEAGAKYLISPTLAESAAGERAGIGAKSSNSSTGPS